MHTFRKCHFKIVEKYVITFTNKNDLEKGTGGTYLKKFLNKIIKNNENMIVKNDIEYIRIMKIKFCIILFIYIIILFMFKDNKYITLMIYNNHI